LREEAAEMAARGFRFSIFDPESEEFRLTIPYQLPPATTNPWCRAPHLNEIGLCHRSCLLFSKGRSILPMRLAIWYMLRRNQLGLHFRRQHVVGPYILDFYCAAAKLCVEVDGPIHAEQSAHDARRTAWLNQQGIRVIRFSVDDVEHRSAAVLATIAQVAAPSTG
jgi:very-short-patch-repair endonuclease